MKSGWNSGNLASYHQCMGEDGWLVRYTVKPQGMFFVEPVAWWQYHAVLRRAYKDMLTRICGAIEPVWIIERSAAYAENVRKPLEIEADGRCTFFAKMQCHSLSASVRPVVIDSGPHAVEDDVLSLEYRFDQKGRASQPLAKGAVTDGDAHRLGGRPIADVAAKAPTLMNDRHEVIQNGKVKFCGRACSMTFQAC
jgi:hypothetical protein